ncbi:MAG: Slp family lipoprotein [candidate division NC10 bacterium]
MPCRRDQLLVLGFSIVVANLAGCASVVPAQLKERVRSVSFTKLQQAPDTYAGTLVLLGGEVLVVKPRGEGMEIEVLERPLGFRDRPRRDRPPRGRFAVLLRPQEGDEQIDKLGPGRLVTVVGEVQGSTTSSSDVPPYNFPLLVARHLHVWPQPVFSGGPEIGFKIRVQESIGF